MCAARRVSDILAEDQQDAQKLGVEGTPYFLVNNMVVRGALPLSCSKAPWTWPLSRTASKMCIVRAERPDLEEILRLQYLAYQSEARLLNNFSIPPLRENLEDLVRQFEAGMVFLKAVDTDGALVGSVRARVEQSRVYVGKLMVHPQRRGKGLGTRLLAALESAMGSMVPQARYELFTRTQSLRNLRLYERTGYRPFREEEPEPGLRLVFLEK